MKALLIVDVRNDFLPGVAPAVADGDLIVPIVTDACRGVNLAPGDVDRAVVEMRGAGVAITTTNDTLGDTVRLHRPVGPGLAS